MIARLVAVVLGVVFSAMVGAALRWASLANLMGDERAVIRLSRPRNLALLPSGPTVAQLPPGTPCYVTRASFSKTEQCTVYVNLPSWVRRAQGDQCVGYTIEADPPQKQGH